MEPNERAQHLFRTLAGFSMYNEGIGANTIHASTVDESVDEASRIHSVNRSYLARRTRELLAEHGWKETQYEGQTYWANRV